jgi:hypothetical protein
MSITWKYIFDKKNKKCLIDTIYCSNIQLSIPINYFFTVLFKDGREYDLTDIKLVNMLKSQIDLDAILDARDNYLKLQCK